MDQSSSYLVVSPEKELAFSPPFSQTVKRTLTVTNAHPTSPIAFKIKTTAPKQYCVRPNSGRVAPNNSIQVQVLLQATKDDNATHTLLSSKSKDKFLVQGIKVPHDVMTLDGDELVARLGELWSQAETLKKTSPDAASQVLAERKLRCVYTENAETEPESGTGNGGRRRSSSAAQREDAAVPREFSDAADMASPRNSLLPSAATSVAPSAVISPPVNPPAYTPLDNNTTTTANNNNNPPAATAPQPGKPALINKPSHESNYSFTASAASTSYATTLQELMTARDKVKQLQAACEGYKEEIERLGALRLRRNDTAAAAAVARGGSNNISPVSKNASAQQLVAQEDHLSYRFVALIVVAAFCIGVFFF
ncbi:PapD-like protein [Powellomyces hirtus]|nr:PapD-like protein [Powellomyces hirtus]